MVLPRGLVLEVLPLDAHAAVVAQAAVEAVVVVFAVGAVVEDVKG